MRLKWGYVIGTFIRKKRSRYKIFSLRPLCEQVEIKYENTRKKLYKAAKRACKKPIQARKLARLLTEYTTMFRTKIGTLDALL